MIALHFGVLGSHVCLSTSSVNISSVASQQSRRATFIKCGHFEPTLVVKSGLVVCLGQAEVLRTVKADWRLIFLRWTMICFCDAVWQEFVWHSVVKLLGGWVQFLSDRVVKLLGGMVQLLQVIARVWGYV